ncbi:hypothetical protein DFH09DRAFT_1291468 [Mycena vulgaris]|nr:hypothetical protein DFH09DRAFT_1291468 [Mycena vulgaris]
MAIQRAKRNAGGPAAFPATLQCESADIPAGSKSSPRLCWIQSSPTVFEVAESEYDDETAIPARRGAVHAKAEVGREISTEWCGGSGRRGEISTDITKKAVATYLGTSMHP